MSRLNDFKSIPIESREERLLRERKEQQGKIGVLDSSLAAAQNEWVSSWFMRQISAPEYEPDPSFSFADNATVKLVTDGVDPHYWSAFEGAQSLGHALDLRDQMREIQETRRAADNSGWLPYLAYGTTNMADPTVAAVSLATGGIGAAATQAGRMAAVARGAALSLGSNLPFEAYRATQDPTYDETQFIASSAGALLLGGLGGAIERVALERAVRKAAMLEPYPANLRAAMGAASANELAGQPGDALRQAPVDRGVASEPRATPTIDESAVAARVSALSDDFPNMSESDLRDMATREFSVPADDDAARMATTPTPPTEPPTPLTGAAPDGEAPTPRVIKAGDFVLDDISTAKSIAGDFSMTGSLGRSDLDDMRWAARALADSATNPVDGSPIGDSGTVFARRQYNKIRGDYFGQTNVAFDEWAKDNGVTWFNRWSKRNAFAEAVGREVRNPSTVRVEHPAVVKAANVVRTLSKEIKDLAERHGVKGFGDLVDNERYFTRIWNQGRINKAIGIYGDDKIADFFAGAIRSQTPDIDPDKATKLGRIFLNALLDLQNYTEVEKALMFSANDTDALERMLANTGKLSPDEIEQIVYAVKPANADSKMPARAKRRFGIDEGYAQTMENGAFLRMDDLLENNADRVFTLYARQMIGHSAMAEVYRAASQRFGRKIDLYTKLRDAIIDRANASNKGTYLAAYKNELRDLDVLYRGVMGLSLHPRDMLGDMLRTIRGVNHVRLQGGFAFNQIGELGNVIGTGGVKATIRSMPAFSEILSRAKDGNLSNRHLRELRIIGMGQDGINSSVIARFDPVDSVNAWGGRLEKTREIVDRAAEFANKASLFAPVNDATQRVAVLVGTESIVDQVLTGKVPSKARLASLGFTPETWAQMAEQLKANVEKVDGLHALNIDSWQDQRSAARLVVGLQKWSERAIQVNDLGNLNYWMTRESGRTLLQFRTFNLVAWQKQTLHRLQMRDVNAFTSAMTASFFAAAAYTSRQYIASLGREDAQEYRDKYLSVDAIAKAGFSRGGWSSIIPDMADTVNQATGGGAVFAAGRTTGLMTGFSLDSNPTSQFIDTMLKAGLTVPGNRLRGDTYGMLSQPEARAYLRLLPFQNIVGIKNVIDAYYSRLPQTAQ